MRDELKASILNRKSSTFIQYEAAPLAGLILVLLYLFHNPPVTRATDAECTNLTPLNFEWTVTKQRDGDGEGVDAHARSRIQVEKQVTRVKKTTTTTKQSGVLFCR